MNLNTTMGLSEHAIWEINNVSEVDDARMSTIDIAEKSGWDHTMVTSAVLNFMDKLGRYGPVQQDNDCYYLNMNQMIAISMMMPNANFQTVEFKLSLIDAARAAKLSMMQELSDPAKGVVIRKRDQRTSDGDCFARLT